MAPRRPKKIVESPESSEAEISMSANHNDMPSDMDDVPPTSPSASKSSVGRSRSNQLNQQPRSVSASKGKKRRPSTLFADASNGGEEAPTSSPSMVGSRPQHKSLQLSVSSFVEQDDRMERRNRRKSTRVSFAPPSSDVEDGGNEKENDEQGDGDNGESSRTPTTRRPRMSASRINAVAPAPAPVVSIDVMNSNFEEWMKMATDNVSFFFHTTLTRFCCGAAP